RRLTTRPARPPPARRYSTPSPQPDRPDPAPMTRPQRDFTLDPPDTERLANLAGPFDAHLRQIELRMGVEIANRGNVFRVTGADERAVARTESLLRQLYDEAAGEPLDAGAIHLRLSAAGAARDDDEVLPQEVAVRVKRGTIRGRGPNQARYLHAIA